MTSEAGGGGAPQGRADGGPGGGNGSEQVGERYAKYVLAVLLIVYVFNFIDRQIISILAEEIKADLGISDADIGFLYGTAFAVFYAVFGIPLGKLADTWSRKSLISLGLGFWSLMTALSGTARSFAALATYRFGVGVGEASATPAAFSMLSDYFAPKVRATVLSIYSSGVYIGAGVGLFLGAAVVDAWEGWYPDAASAPFGLQGWQAAFLAVGLPGLLMAVWVWMLREPVRGLSEGLRIPPDTSVSANARLPVRRAAALHSVQCRPAWRCKGLAHQPPVGGGHRPVFVRRKSGLHQPGAMDRPRPRALRRRILGAGA